MLLWFTWLTVCSCRNCHMWAQAADGNVYNGRTITWASSKYDEFHFSFSIAVFYESNLILHVFVREIPWAPVHLLIKRHEWCLESFGNCTSYGSAYWKLFINKLWITINYGMQELFMLFYVCRYVINKTSYKYCSL